MNPVQLMHINRTSMTKSEVKIMDYILSNLESVKNLPMVELANLTDTSRSVLLRFTQKLGYKGYSEFKYALVQYIDSPEPIITSQKTVAQIISESISQLDETIDKTELSKLVSYFKKYSRVKIFGYAETGLTAQHLSMRLLDSGYDAEAITTLSMFEKKIEICNEVDFLMFFSMSATTEVIKNAINYAKAKGLPSVLITQNTQTNLNDAVDCSIYLPFFDVQHSNFILDSQVILHGFSGILMNELFNDQKE